MNINQFKINLFFEIFLQLNFKLNNNIFNFKFYLINLILKLKQNKIIHFVFNKLKKRKIGNKFIFYELK